MADTDKTRRMYVQYELSGNINIEIPDIEYENDEALEKAIIRELQNVNILAFVKHSGRPHYKTWSDIRYPYREEQSHEFKKQVAW